MIIIIYFSTGKAYKLKLLTYCMQLFPYKQRAIGIYVIVKERHETIMGYKPRERVALEWFIPIIVELLVL